MPKPHKTPKINPSAKTTQYRNQISTLLAASPLKFLLNFHKKHVQPGGATSPLPETPTRNHTKRQNQAIRKTAQYRNQISTLLGVPPLKFLLNFHKKHVQPGGATSPLPATPTRNRTKHPKSSYPQKQRDAAIKFPLFLGSLP